MYSQKGFHAFLYSIDTVHQVLSVPVNFSSCFFLSHYRTYRLGERKHCNQCCGSGIFFPIPDPTFFHPRSQTRIFPSRIPDPHQRIKYFNPNKMVSKLQEIWSGLFIPDPGSGSWLFTHPGSRGQKGTGSRIRNTDCNLPNKKEFSAPQADYPGINRWGTSGNICFCRNQQVSDARNVYDNKQGRLCT